jgi:hypothetical protein
LNPTQVYKTRNKTEYGRHILNSNNVTRTSWKLINKELGKDHKTHGIQSVNIDGRCPANQQIIIDAFNEHFTTIPEMINKTFMQITVLLKPLSITRISFPIL